jgi:hypothetical protein
MLLCSRRRPSMPLQDNPVVLWRSDSQSGLNCADRLILVVQWFNPLVTSCHRLPVARYTGQQRHQ